MSRDAALAILTHNLGFEFPEEWVNYATTHSFARVRATAIPLCPDCGAPPTGQLGQYVYYSTLLRLRVCGACGLIWADAHLDPEVVAAHFEGTYKSREYFLRARSWIFRHLVAELDRLTPTGASVLDVGGAQGDLMHQLQRRRPDIRAVVQDLSEGSLRHAEEEFGLETLQGSLGALQSHAACYDVVVLSDVLYYEPRLADFWQVLPRLVSPGGAVVIRVPNKLLLIRLLLAWSRLRQLAGPHRLETRVRYFNPEHIYLLTRRYLASRLQRLGFDEVRVLPSPPLLSSASGWRQLLGRVLFGSAELLGAVSGGRLVLTPSMVVVGRRGYGRARGDAGGGK